MDDDSHGWSDDRRSVDDPRWADVLGERTAQARAQRDALRAAIEETREARSLMFADDEHDPDGSTASLDQARDVALLARTEQTLAELAAAGQRLADGTYGQCRNCHRTIGAERLLARPETAVCVSCAAVAGRRRRG